MFLIHSHVAADSWVPAKLKVQISQNGKYVVSVMPGDSMGDVYGFSGAKIGKYAKAHYFRCVDDEYKKSREFGLVNPISPLFIAITDRGILITLDNWHNMGYSCVHACAGLLNTQLELIMDVYSYVSDFFKTSEYLKCYSGSITVAALPDPNTPIPDDSDKPPVCTRQPGRPAKRRRQARDASSKTVTCSRCGKPGHNRGSCAEPATL